MRLVMLGTGTGTIRSERRSSSVLVQTNRGETAIVDCGWGVPDALARLNFPLHRLGHLAITNGHADRLSGVPSLLYSQFVAGQRNLGPARDRKLRIHGYPGIGKDVAALCGVMIPEMDLDKCVTFVEQGQPAHAPKGALAISSIRTSRVSTGHAVSFSLEADGKKAVVTGSFGWNDAVIDQMMGADMAVIGASATRAEYNRAQLRSAMAPIQCGEMAARASVKRLVLNSLPDIDSVGDVIAAAQWGFRGPVVVPQDGQVFDL